MDEPRLPKELEDLWRGPNPPEENVDVIVEQVLLQARKFQDRHRAWDVATNTLCAVFIPLVIVVTAIANPLVLPGIVMTSLIMAACVWNTRKFNRSVGQEPAPNRSTEEHLAWSLTFLDHRERLYRSNGRWGNWLSPVATILVPAGMFRSGDVTTTGCVVMAALLAAAWLAGNAMTKCVLGQISEERARVRKTYDDLTG